jgi:hypothetical protein
VKNVINIIAKESRENLPSPLYSVKQLKLKAYSLPTRQIHELVDTLLWICPLLEILFIEWQYEEAIDNISFTFTEKKEGNISFKVLHMFIS